MPMPVNSPVLTGEDPLIKSPWEVDNAKVSPVVTGEDTVPTHQFTIYLPAVLNVITPVEVLTLILPDV